MRAFSKSLAQRDQLVQCVTVGPASVSPAVEGLGRFHKRMPHECVDREVPRMRTGAHGFQKK